MPQSKKDVIAKPSSKEVRLESKIRAMECAVAILIMIIVVLALFFATWSVYYESGQVAGTSTNPGAGNI